MAISLSPRMSYNFLQLYCESEQKKKKVKYSKSLCSQTSPCQRRRLLSGTAGILSTVEMKKHLLLSLFCKFGFQTQTLGQKDSLFSDKHQHMCLHPRSCFFLKYILTLPSNTLLFLLHLHHDHRDLLHLFSWVWSYLECCFCRGFTCFGKKLFQILK